MSVDSDGGDPVESIKKRKRTLPLPTQSRGMENNKTYVKPLYKRLFSENHSTDCVVYVASTEDEKIGNKNPTYLTKLFTENVKGIVGVHRLNAYKIGVTFKKPAPANNFLKMDDFLSKYKLKAFIPAQMTEKTGVIRFVPIDMTNEEIYKNISCDTEVISIKRFMKKVDGKLIPLGTVAVTFAGTSLPQYAYIQLFRYKVHTYIPPLVQCYKCLKFNHSAKVCRGEQMCSSCAGQHSYKDCDSDSLVCINCGGHHLAISRDCPVKQKKMEEKKNKFLNQSYATVDCVYTMKHSRSELWSQYLKIFLVVSCYWIVSIVTVFVNKALLSSQSVSLEAPLFITWFQCVVSFTICYTLSQSGGIPGIFAFPRGTPWNMDVIKKVIPLSIMFTLMIATNNLCLKYVGVPFYYVGRSLTTVFNVVFSYVLLRQTTSWRCILCCLFIIFGFYLGVDQENLLGSFSLKGTIYGVIGSLSLSLYSIYTKKILPFVNQEVWLLSYYNNAYSIILFMPLMAVNGEFNVLLNYNNFDSTYFWIQMVVGGICGFAIGYVTSLQIKVTSPLTHNISGTAKACVQTVIATQWFNETKNVLWWTSNVIVLASSALYARFKQIEMEKKSRLPLLEERKSVV